MTAPEVRYPAIQLKDINGNFVFLTLNENDEILVKTDKEYSNRYYINKGLGWNIAYSFTLDKNETMYLAFETNGSRIHATARKVRVIDLNNQPIYLEIVTLKNATVDVLGSDISDRIFNADLNLGTENIDLIMYDETTTIEDEGTEAPFSSTLRSERRTITEEYIENEYILRENGYRVLKFNNLSDNSEVKIEYNSTGYQEE